MKPIFSFLALFVSVLGFAQLPPPTYYDLPLSIRSQLVKPSYIPEIPYLLKNEFPEFISAPNLPLPAGYPLIDPKHDVVAEAMALLGIKNYLRHFKTDGFRRVPLCGDANNLEPYYNYYYYTESGCDNTPGAETKPWMNRIIDDAHDEGSSIGLYIKAMSDFFLQMDYQTGDPFQVDDKFSTCICKTYQELNYDDNFPISNYQNYIANAIPEPDLYTALNATVTYPLENPDNTTFYLCVNCPVWRARLQTRLAEMRDAGADFIFFDVDNMPEEGCFCTNCRDKFSEVECNGLSACRQNGSGQNSYLHGFSYAPPSQPSNSNNPIIRRNMSDLMNRSLIDHFNALQATMHGNNQQKGALAMVSTGGFLGLIKDDHRVAFVNTIDIPKGEWNMPLKSANNMSFFDGGVLSILSHFRIPENIRLMGAMDLSREASRYKMQYLWQPYHLRPLEALAQGLNESDIVMLNNDILRTNVGASVVCGAMNGSTFEDCISFDANEGLKLNMNALELCSFANIPSSAFESISLSCPSNTNITPIAPLAAHFNSLIAGKRPYTWAGIYYSELARNKYLYETGIGVGNADRLAGAWQNVLMPMYLGYQSFMGGRIPNLSQDKRYYPVGFVFDRMLVPSNVKLIVKPVNVENNFNALPEIPVINILSHSTNANEPQNQYYKIDDPTATINLMEQTLSFGLNLASAPAPFYLTNSSSLSNLHVNFYTDAGYNLNQTMPCALTSILTVPMVLDPAKGVTRGKWFRYKVSRSPFHSIFDFDLEANNNQLLQVITNTNNTSTFTNEVTVPDGYIGAGKKIQISIIPNGEGSVDDQLLYTFDGQTPGIVLNQANNLGQTVADLWFYSGELDQLYAGAYDHPLETMPGNALTLHVNKSWLQDKQICGALLHLSDANLTTVDITSSIQSTQYEYLITVPSFTCTAVLEIKGFNVPTTSSTCGCQ